MAQAPEAIRRPERDIAARGGHAAGGRVCSAFDFAPHVIRSMSTTMLAQEFAAKAKVNAEFVLTALKGMGRDALGGVGVLPALGLQPGNQLIAEGIELALKALMLARGSVPPADHSLRALYAVLDDADKVFVDEAVRSAIDQSAAGPVPFGLPNVASAAVRGGAPLGEADPTVGYADMDAAAFFAVLDATWGAESSQYLGADRHFVVGKVVRTNTRVLAGGILVCLGLAEPLANGAQGAAT